MTRFLARLLGHRPDRDDPIHALRLKMAARLLARREARRATNVRARAGAATKIHKQFERDPLIRAARGLPEYRA